MVFFEFCSEYAECAPIQSLAHLAHEAQVVMQIVDRGEHFAAAIQVV